MTRPTPSSISNASPECSYPNCDTAGPSWDQQNISPVAGLHRQHLVHLCSSPSHRNVFHGGSYVLPKSDLSSSSSSPPTLFRTHPSAPLPRSLSSLPLSVPSPAGPHTHDHGLLPAQPNVKQAKFGPPTGGSVSRQNYTRSYGPAS